MEYGIWGLHAAGGLWGDPRLAGRHPILPPGATQMVPRAAFALSALQRSSDMIPLPLTAIGPPYGAMELISKPSEDSEESDKASRDQASRKSEDNESSIEKDEDENDNQTGVTTMNNENEDAEEDSDDRSTTSSSHRSANNNLSSKSPDPISYLMLDKDDTVTPVLNGWVLGAYTAMLGRLSAATAALEATEIPNILSDSDSDSDHSSYTEKSGKSSPDQGAHRGYSCRSCDVVAPSRPALRKHILQSHPFLAKSDSGEMKKCPSSGCDFTTTSRCEFETHVANHVTQGVTPTGKKRTLALQRVRYRYEREEYRCSLCSYACTIEKAFQRHLRAHAKGSAPETRVSCAVCGADRSSEVDLSKHMRRHRDDRYFCCDICIFRTVQLKKLIQHRRMHTGEKPHLCPHCAYRSARRDNLRSHVRRVHKKENLYCDTFSPRGMLIAPTIREVTAAVEIPVSSPSSPSSNPETAN
ncbi:RE1-silencing transcription factor B-like [Belonocnema kinseyi]|uniref:RE1-silencing transcription factor B-like n=1 Tax=Belonocnema kinseyi TaxID=2817044 RepID=UPI00143D1019|nr:RE1-silencing transcription factor B-like [Belonocnema kinseyi]